MGSRPTFRDPKRDRARAGTALRALFVLAGLLGGCQQGAPPPAGAIRVDGTVTLDGKPLPRGTVQFAARQGTDSGTGRIDGQGRFKVWLQPGDYRIAVVCYDGIERVDAGGMPLGQKPFIPTRYFAPDESGLEATVNKDHRRVDLSLAK